MTVRMAESAAVRIASARSLTDGHNPCWTPGRAHWPKRGSQNCVCSESHERAYPVLDLWAGPLAEARQSNYDAAGLLALPSDYNKKETKTKFAITTVVSLWRRPEGYRK
jgi:hypothetical protein